MDKIKTSITELFSIDYPIIQGGMIWCSGHKLVSAVSNCGGLGLIGGGSMRPELFREHIRGCKNFFHFCGKSRKIYIFPKRERMQSCSRGFKC